MHDKIMKLTAIYGSIFTVLAMCFMLFFIENRTVTYASDGALTENDSELLEKINDIDSNSIKELTITQEKNTNFLYIPVKEDIMEDEVSIVNNYLEHAVTLYIEGMEENYFENNSITGNGDKIKSIQYTYQNGVTKLVIELNDIYECEISKENSTFCLDFKYPRDLYDKIIVIDPGHGGSEHGNFAYGLMEKEITLDIAIKLQSLLAESDIKGIFTRLDDSNPEIEKRVQFANDVNADMFISIHAFANMEDVDMYGIQTVYNSHFFIPQFSSLELADILERSVATAVNGRANGLIIGSEENVIVSEATIPVALIEVGFLSNEKEALLLGKEEYRMKIAEGIYKGVLEAYEVKGVE